MGPPNTVAYSGSYPPVIFMVGLRMSDTRGVNDNIRVYRDRPFGRISLYAIEKRPCCLGV
jgi:hypothetical protein